MELSELFDKHRKEHLKFDRVENKRSNRPDLHAFLLLDELVPGSSDIVSAAEHDEIYFDVKVSELGKVITEEQVIELLRCGFLYHDEYECLFSFV